MESTRQQKIARLIQKDLSVYFQQSQVIYGGAMITVTKVYVTRDLSIAKIYLSLFAPKGKSGVLELIRSHTREIRHHLAGLERNQLRVIPDLQFFEDDSLDYIENIENLLKS
ncbi:MAG TPA: 30S ribosome-binding factor RbfA [Bacteroidales bacterium]|nr:30S ribosome-binding factor RbfA [Bacteroidales bacterium]HPS73973.1 30S ribosome-binding factor RbfA [Bacteroidales bacterium]